MKWALQEVRYNPELNSTHIWFEHNFVDTQLARHVIEKYRLENVCEYHLGVILINMLSYGILQIEHSTLSCLVMLDKNLYTTRKQKNYSRGLTYDKLRKALDSLQDVGLIRVDVGNYIQGLTTQLHCKEELQKELITQLLLGKTRPEYRNTLDPIEIRTPKRKKKKKYKDTPQVRSIKSRLSKINKVNLAASYSIIDRPLHDLQAAPLIVDSTGYICTSSNKLYTKIKLYIDTNILGNTILIHTISGGGNLISPNIIDSFQYVFLNRLFNQQLTLGGRYYSRLHSLKRAARKRLRIDDEEPVELDYSGIHPTILYHQSNLEVDGDVYEIGRPSHDRPLIKKILLIAINTATRSSMVAALHKDQRKKRIATTPARLVWTILEQLERKHPLILSHFYKLNALRLHNLDSRIAEEVMYVMTKQGRPCLSIHDSFIVKVSDEECLRKAMIEAYQKIIKTKYCPKIDRK